MFSPIRRSTVSSVVKISLLFLGVALPLAVAYACDGNWSPNPCWGYECQTSCATERAEAIQNCQMLGGDLDPLATCVTTACGCTKLSTANCVEAGDGQSTFDIEGDAYEFQGL